MKKTKSVLTASGRFARLLLAIPLSMALSLTTMVPAAGAITRSEVMQRANSWVHKRVRYSQSGYSGGYRRDCSGMVSMAWGLGKSYTSSNIASRATRIGFNELKPGDALLRRGRHVEIFGGWKDRRQRTFYALEQVGWGQVASKRVKDIPRGAVAIRLKGIQDAPTNLMVASVPATAQVAQAAPAPQPSTVALTALATPALR